MQSTIRELLTITTTNNFEEKIEAIIALCKNKLGQDEINYKNIASTLLVMAAILNRNENELSPNEDIDEINWNIDTYALQVRPDLLRLYIARHKGKNKYHKSCYIKFGYATESVEIQTTNGSDIYTTLTVQGLEPGDVVYVYENGRL